MNENIASSPPSQSNIVAKIHEALAKVKAAARVKQRTVENLIESAQAAHGKVLQKFNEHIDFLEHEKVRLAKETEQAKADREEAQNELLADKETVLAIKKELGEQKEEFSRKRNEFTQKIEELENEKQSLTKRVGSLEEHLKGAEKRNNDFKNDLQAAAEVEKSLEKKLADTTEAHQAELKKLREDSAREIDSITNKAKDQSAINESTIAALQKEKNELSQLRDKLSQSVTLLESSVDSLKNEKDQTKKVLTQEINELIAQRTALQSEKEAMLVKLDQFQRAWDNMES